ncbi:MAG: hypothetical protein AB7G40_13235 [Hyphomonadaceae bacterium]
MADVFEWAYKEREDLLNDLKEALEAEGVAEADAKAVCDAVENSALIAMGKGVVGYTTPQFPPGHIGMMFLIPVLGIGFVFNGKKAAVKLGITAAGALIGGPAAFLALMQNLVGHDFAVIDYESGMVCNLATLLDANTPLNASSLAATTAGRSCLRPQTECKHRNQDRCSIGARDVEQNMMRLEERKAVVSTDSGAFRANRL